MLVHPYTMHSTPHTHTHTHSLSLSAKWESGERFPSTHTADTERLGEPVCRLEELLDAVPGAPISLDFKVSSRTRLHGVCVCACVCVYVYQRHEPFSRQHTDERARLLFFLSCSSCYRCLDCFGNLCDMHLLYACVLCVCCCCAWVL